jgi:hypothetical protein
MVDTLMPLLPPAIPNRVERSQVTEKNPHHQKEQQHKKKQEEEIEDEVVIESLLEEEITPTENKKPTPPANLHKIDIEV